MTKYDVRRISHINFGTVSQKNLSTYTKNDKGPLLNIAKYWHSIWLMTFRNIIKVLVNKTNRRTEFQFYWYYDSTCFRQPFCPSSGVLSRTSALVRFMQIWWPFATRSRKELSSFLLLVANGHQICLKCTNADVRLRTSDGGQKGCPNM